MSISAGFRNRCKGSYAVALHVEAGMARCNCGRLLLTTEHWRSRTVKGATIRSIERRIIKHRTIPPRVSREHGPSRYLVSE